MISPIIYDLSWPKQKLWEAGIEYIYQAARIWGVPRPVIISSRPAENSYRFLTGGTMFGEWTRPDRIFVNVKMSTTPIKTRGRIWSYPGHKTDRTCAGILAHEFAHHLAGNTKMDFLRWRRIVANTKPVTGYEPTAGEAFAESGRIFILNPDLLWLGRPERFTFFAQYFAPLHTRTWGQVLTNAPDFIKESAAKFCQEVAR